MTPIQVVGIGLEGATALSAPIQAMVHQATLLVGSDRHLQYFPHHPAPRVVLGDFLDAVSTIRHHLDSPTPVQIVILTSGDPLFFGLGRLLLREFSPDQITFHPHVSSIQLAFSRIKVPWQDARVISAHGRSLDELTQALQQGAKKIAVLTDPTHTPGAIARLMLDLDLPVSYHSWVCENLGGDDERVQEFAIADLLNRSFAPLNVLVLMQSEPDPKQSPVLDTLPRMGIPDATFLSFSDRPGLMTKREVRILVLGELALQPGQIIWDIGAGTGSVSIEIARLLPDAQIYAIEKTSAGILLIQQNCERFHVRHIMPIHGEAPQVLKDLPNPDRIFIGGSSGALPTILETCRIRLAPGGTIVLALATVNHLTKVFSWLEDRSNQGDPWHSHLLQVQLARSVSVGPLTRFSPLNPVTLVTLHQ